MSIPALNSDNPYSDAEFVIYSTTEDMVAYEPQTEIGEETGFVSIGLWARYPEDGCEVPLFSQSEQGTWLSLDADMSKNSDDEVVSNAFTQAVAHLTDKDEGDGWGGIEEDTWEEMSYAEQYITGQFRHALIGGSPAPEVVLAMEACKERLDGGSE